jgi:hypothetical protein
MPRPAPVRGPDAAGRGSSSCACSAAPGPGRRVPAPRSLAASAAAPPASCARVETELLFRAPQCCLIGSLRGGRQTVDLPDLPDLPLRRAAGPRLSPADPSRPSSSTGQGRLAAKKALIFACPAIPGGGWREREREWERERERASGGGGGRGDQFRFPCRECEQRSTDSCGCFSSWVRRLRSTGQARV